MSFIKKPAAAVSALSGLTIDADKVWENLGVQMGISNIKEVAAGMAEGDMIYHDGTKIVKITPGAVGTGFKTKGVGHNPIWSFADLLP